MIKGTSKGIHTDTDGKFTLTIPNTGKVVVLSISYVGMETREIGITTQKTIKIKLESDTEIGEVVVVPPEDGSRPAGLFSGYLADPERDAQAWAGGVYHTGDAAWQTADGSYWFHGRFDDIIKTGGYRVGPGEIESVLMEHPAVLECSVVGVPDSLRGQAIQAVVVLTPGQEAGPTLEREIREFCNQKLAAYKWVRQVKFVEALPKTISGKIRRHTLRVP